MFRTNNHRDLPETFRTYARLLYRIVSSPHETTNAMHLAEETDSWSLAEMQWILDLFAFAQKVFFMNFPLNLAGVLEVHIFVVLIQQPGQPQATAILFAEVEFSKETPGAFGDCAIGEAENLTKNEGAVLQPLTRSWELSPIELRGNYPLWIRLREDSEQFTILKELKTGLRLPDCMVSEFPGAGLHLDEKNGGHEDMDLPKHQQG
ncbi:hypothetical protein V8E54_013906 [Elaphomyces granulatus]